MIHARLFRVPILVSGWAIFRKGLLRAGIVFGEPSANAAQRTLFLLRSVNDDLVLIRELQSDVNRLRLLRGYVQLSHGLLSPA